MLEKEINDIKKKLNISSDDVIYYDINSVSDIVNEALTISMFSLNKLIIVDSTSYLSDKKDISDINLLEDYFNNYNPNSYLIFISNSGSIDSRKKLVKLLSSKGKVSNPTPSEDYLRKYITEYLISNRYKIDSLSVNFLLQRVGNNINNVTNELDKLMLYKENDKNILREDINLLVEENIDDTVYSLTNSLLKNESGKALKLYYKFKESGMDDSQIIAVIASQIRLLFQVKRLYNSGKSNEEIAKILEFRNVYRVKYLLSDSYYYSESDLIKYLSKLADIDKNIKLGTMDGRVFLEIFIAEKDM